MKMSRLAALFERFASWVTVLSGSTMNESVFTPTGVSIGTVQFTSTLASE